MGLNGELSGWVQHKAISPKVGKMGAGLVVQIHRHKKEVLFRSELDDELGFPLNGDNAVGAAKNI